MRNIHRALITGGAGFIGSHLADALTARGAAVVALDNLSNGRLENLHKAMATGLCRVVKADINFYEEIAGAFREVDTVFHLAGQADIVPGLENPRPYFQTNVQGTVNVLEAARSAGALRVVYAASSTCYGDDPVVPTPENHPVVPQHPYALSKWQGEQCVLHWSRVYGLGANSLRLFHVYGRRAQGKNGCGGVFKVFLPQKLAGKPFTVAGDGLQRRDFVHVADVVRALTAAARCDESGLVLNVGGGDPQSILRLVELLGGETVPLPKRPGEPVTTWADIGAIRRVLGWRPQVSFEDGVAELLAHIEEYRAAVLWDETSLARASEIWFAQLGP